MLGHSQTCEVQPIAREDCSFHWCAAQSTLECTGELGTENAFESTGSKGPGDENIPYISDTGTEDITQCMLSGESFSLAINLITQQKHKEHLCILGRELNVFTFPEYIVTLL